MNETFYKNIYNLFFLYDSVIIEFKKHLAVVKSEIFKESVISHNSISLINKTLDNIPIFFQRVIDFVKCEETDSAVSQLDFIIDRLKHVLKEIKSIKEILISHKNDVSLPKSDLEAILKLEELAKEQLSQVNDYKENLVRINAGKVII